MAAKAGFIEHVAAHFARQASSPMLAPISKREADMEQSSLCILRDELSSDI